MGGSGLFCWIGLKIRPGTRAFWLGVANTCERTSEREELRLANSRSKLMRTPGLTTSC